MTLRSSDLQSDSDLDSIRNSCDVSLSNGPGCKDFDAVHSARTPGLLNCRIGGVVLRKRIRGGCMYRVGPGNGRLELDCLHLKMESEAGAIYSTLTACSKSLKGEGNSSETS